MAADIGQPYFGWSHDEISDRNDEQGAPVCQLLDHGSVSFGRFAVEPLSWEKKSVFTRNRCLEELENLKAPGLVAQKKAYFEEYYKRIRKLKASQDNEQAEIALEYSGDGSVSSHSGEDDKGAKIIGPGNGELCSNDILPEGITDVQAPCEKDKSNDMNAIEMSFNSDLVVQQENTDSIIVTEVIEDHDVIKLDKEGASNEHNNPVSSMAPSVSFKDNKMAVHVLERIKRKTTFGSSNNMSDFGHPKYSNLESCEVISSGKKCEGHPLLSKFKEFAVVSKKGAKFEAQIGPDKVKPSYKPKGPIHKGGIRPERNIDSARAGMARFARNGASVASHPAATVARPSSVSSERQPKIPHPSSVIAQRRAITPSGRKQVVTKWDSTIHNGLPSSLNRSRGAMNVLGASKGSAIFNDVKSRESENRRCYEDARKVASVLDKQAAGKDRSRAAVCGGPAARSVSVTACNKSRPGRGYNHKVEASHGGPNQEVKKEKVMPSLNGNPRNGTKKTCHTLDKNNTSSGWRKQQIGNLSLDARKPRREMPPWR